MRCGLVLLLAALLTLTNLGTTAGARLEAPQPPRAARLATTPINYVIIVIMENYAFDTVFGRFPGANGALLTATSAPFPFDFDHSGPGTRATINGGRMDQFPEQRKVQYTQADLPNYWRYAQEFGLSDNFFASLPTSSTPNHLVLIAADGADLDSTGPAGCRFPQNSLLVSRDESGVSYWDQACFDIETLPRLLEQHGLTWRYYNNNSGWDAPALIADLAGSPNDIKDPNQFFTHVRNGRLANVSWVKPHGFLQSDHPPRNIITGENFVVDVVNAVMQSPYWNESAIFVTWDDPGGFYDHVAPPQGGPVEYGLRVPLLVISPYARRGYLSHQFGEFSSLVKFIEANWGLPSLGRRDALAATGDLRDFFDFSQAPRPPLVLDKQPDQLTLRLVTDGVNQLVGGPRTVFQYSVGWMSPTLPTVAEVLIDGVAYPMVRTQSNARGSLYQYATRLPVGRHSFQYRFSDGTRMYLLPGKGLPMPGPDVRPFNVTARTVTPPQSLADQPITFSAIYQHDQGVPPAMAEVRIDGVAYPMTPVGPLDYRAGVQYTFTTSALAPGRHYTAFYFDDGSGPAVFELINRPVISEFFIGESSVTPTSGSTATVFTFQTTYVSADGRPPQTARVYVDNVPYEMRYVSGRYETGAIYQAQLTLPAGRHRHYFLFSNGSSDWADPFFPTLFDGPNVGPGAEPVPPGSLVEYEEDFEFFIPIGYQ